MPVSRSFKLGKYIGDAIRTGTITSSGGVSTAAVEAAGAGGVTTYTNINNLPTSHTAGDLAFVDSSDRLYISNGEGWYSISIVNATPYWDSAPSAEYTVADSATPLIVTAKALDSDGTPGITYTGFASDSAQYLVTITTDSSVTTFTPLSVDSVGNNATLGNIPDSTGGSFTYTFRATDGIGIISQVSTITYVASSVITTAQLIAGGYSSGIYNINGVDTYFNASTGYALYSSFGTSNTYGNSGTYPAQNGNGIKYSQLSTYGYSLNASSQLSWADGTSTGGAWSGNYTAKTGYFAFYGGSANTANFDLTTWNGPSNVTDLRVVWGNGDTGNTGTDGALYINNTSIRSSMSGQYIDTSSFSSTGSTPLLRVYEGNGSIAGIGQIWFRNG